jgi:serine/threonine-protein kinase RsbW
MHLQALPRLEPNEEKPLFKLAARVPAHPKSISPVVERLMAGVRAWTYAPEKEFAIEIALREALANAILHGCGNDAKLSVECSVSCSKSGELCIVVRDPGPGFDPATVPDPLAEENVRSTHGRGLYLISQVMDRVWFERMGSEIHMVLRLAQSSAASAQAPGFSRS